ncbi:MAG: HAD family hydrolase [Pseudomonadota bacterium]
MIPVSTKILQQLRAVRGYLFDMDGTLVLGDKHNSGMNPLPGAREIIAHLRQRQVPLVIFTNGTARPPAHYAKQLRAAGFDIGDHEFMTPASSAADLFVAKGYRRVMVLGGEGVSQPLEAAGIEVLAPRGKQKVDAVLAGWYREFTMECLEAACHAVSEGAPYYSCSQAAFFATAGGRALGTSRVISAMVKDVTGCKVNVVGKPSLDALRGAARRLGVKPAQMAVVGDDPVLEVPMARRGGAFAVAVNSGLGSPDAYLHLAENRQPHVLLEGVDALLELCKRTA